MKLDVLERANEIRRDMVSVLQRIESLKTGLNILTNDERGAKLNIAGNTYSIELDNTAAVYAVNNILKRLNERYKTLADQFEEL